jgi:hypothetical protein
VGANALTAFAAALHEAGLRVRCREANTEDVKQSGSSWAKRLDIPRQRAAYLLTARKP